MIGADIQIKYEVRTPPQFDLNRADYYSAALEAGRMGGQAGRFRSRQFSVNTTAPKTVTCRARWY